MRHNGSKLEGANVVAGFDSQWNADEAVLELRLAGFRDRRIGYYYPGADGRLVDLLAGHHRLAAALLGGGLGAVLGALAAVPIARMWGGLGPDLMGLAVTCAICGALLLGTAGGMMGLWTARPGEYAPAPRGTTAPFVLAVDAGDARDRVRAILRRHGGHELQPDGSEMPAAQPA